MGHEWECTFEGGLGQWEPLENRRGRGSKGFFAYFCELYLSMAPKAKSNYQFHAMSKSFWSRDKHLLFKIGPLKLCLSHNCSQVLLFHNFVRCFVTDLVSSYVFAVWSWKSLACAESSSQKALLGAFFHLSMYHQKNLTHFIFEDVCSSSIKI